ncbi:hypothetical protein OUZ56_032636, partial [Daphnia magna]
MPPARRSRPAMPRPSAPRPPPPRPTIGLAVSAWAWRRRDERPGERHAPPRSLGRRGRGDAGVGRAPHAPLARRPQPPPRWDAPRQSLGGSSSETLVRLRRGAQAAGPELVCEPGAGRDHAGGVRQAAHPPGAWSICPGRRRAEAKPMSLDGYYYMSPGLPLMPYPRHFPPRFVVVPDCRNRVTAEVNARNDQKITVYVRADSAQFDGKVNRMQQAVFLVARAVAQSLERTFEGKLWGDFVA